MDCWAGYSTLNELYAALNSDLSVSDGSCTITEFRAPRLQTHGYAARISAVITPEETGDYTFHITSSGQSQLYVGVAGEGHSLQARVLPTQTDLTHLTWNTYADQSSAPMTLEVGVNYYIDFRYVGNRAAAHAILGWSGPGTNGIERISSDRVVETTTNTSVENILMGNKQFYRLIESSTNQDADTLTDEQELQLGHKYPVSFFQTDNVDTSLGGNTTQVLADLEKRYPDDLPDWYRRNRVQWHWVHPGTNVSNYADASNWVDWLEGVHDVIAESGVKVATLTGTFGAEGAWWPSEVGTPYAPFEGYNILKDHTIDDMAEHDINTIVYYRHDIDYALQESNPEWGCVNAQGFYVYKNRGTSLYGKAPLFMCQNSPFREFTKQRLVEIAEMGAAGVYFDEGHMPETCYCDNCKAAYLEKYGEALPAPDVAGTQNYLDVARFVGETLTEAFTEWKEALHAVNPEFTLIVSTSNYSEFFDLLHSEEMSRAGSVNKSEFQKCFGERQHLSNSPIVLLRDRYPEYWKMPVDLGESLEWMLTRDVNDAAPAHIWVYQVEPEDEDEILHTASAVVAHGGIANMHLQPLKNYLPYYEKTMEMNDALAESMVDARPYAWATIHISNSLKESLYVAGGTETTENYRHRFENLYAPVAGAAHTLRSNHLPYDTTCDTRLLNGNFYPETEILIVPSYDLLSTELQDAIDNSGLTVIKLTGDWHLTVALDTQMSTLEAQLVAPPFSIDGPDNLFATYMIDQATNDIIVSLVRDWNWFWIWGPTAVEGQIRSENVAAQPAIENFTINVPGEKTVIYPSSDAVDDPLDICRFIKVTR